MFDKNPQLHCERLIKPQLSPNAVNLFLVRKQARQHIRGVTTNPIEKKKYQQDHTGQGWNHLPDAAKDIGTHVSVPLRFLNVIVNPITQDQGVFAKAFQTLMAKPRRYAC